MSEVAVLSLTGFLLARLEADERAARAEFVVDVDHGGYFLADSRGETVLAVGPSRVLAEVAAKRAIVEQCAWADGDGQPDHETERAAEDAVRVLRHLAAVYADHPDYRDEWRP